MARLPGSGAGFTLIEVVVAFAIAALSLGVLMQAFAGDLRRSALLSEYREAVSLAESELARIGREAPLTIGAHEVLHEDGYRVRRDIQPYTEDERVSSRLRVYRVTVSVSWPGPVQARQVVLSSVRLGEVS